MSAAASASRCRSARKHRKTLHRTDSMCVPGPALEIPGLSAVSIYASLCVVGS
jgi:hypothetical protein